MFKTIQRWSVFLNYFTKWIRLTYERTDKIDNCVSLYKSQESYGILLSILQQNFFLLDIRKA